MLARKGRASYLGERSIGHQDPGATSSWLLVRSAAETLGPDGPTPDRAAVSRGRPVRGGPTPPRGVPTPHVPRGRAALLQEVVVTVGIVVVSHSAALAAAAAELAAEMAGDRLRLALAGGIDDEAPARHRRGQGHGRDRGGRQRGRGARADGPRLGGAVRRDGARICCRRRPPQRVVLCEAPIVEGLIAAAVQASAGAPIDEVVGRGPRGLDAKASHLGVEVASAARRPRRASATDRASRPCRSPSPTRSASTPDRPPGSWSCSAGWTPVSSPTAPAVVGRSPPAA
jgi:hypothetical protein